MDIRGGHLGCPWTYRGVILGFHGPTGGSSGVCPWTYTGVIWGVHGHTGGSFGMSMDKQRVIWVVKGKGPKAQPMNGPKGPQPSAGTRNKRAKRALFLVNYIICKI